MTSNTLILGSGIISLSLTHYLSTSTPASTIHLIDPSPHLFHSASGRAAGFLASDWFGPSTSSLGALSFSLHKQLAEEHGGRERWGYSVSTGTSVTGKNGERGDEWLRDGGSRAGLAKGGEMAGGAGPGWLVGGSGVSVISEGGTTAQVDPLRLCKFLLGEALEKGVRLHQPARAVSVAMDLRGELASVRVLEEGGEEVDIPCTRLIIAAGAWTPRVFSTLFPTSTLKIPISTLAGHSLVVKSPRWTKSHEASGCHAVFATDAAGFSPEIFSRVGGEIYIAGLNDSELPLPELATDAVPDGEAVEVLKRTAKRMLGLPGGEDDLEVVRTGLCFRPVTERGPPIVCRVPDGKLGEGVTTRAGKEGGVFIAAGHGPWGITQSLGTGKVLAEMIEGLPTSADVSGLTL